MNPLEEFINEHPRLDGSTVREAYAVYTLWTCENGLKALSRSNFANHMERLGFKICVEAKDNGYTEIFKMNLLYLLGRISHLEARVKALEEREE